MKKTVSFLLVLCMLCTLCGFSVMAQGEDAVTLQDTETISVFYQQKEFDSDKHDMRIVISVDQDFLAEKESLAVTVSFRTADDTLSLTNYLRSEKSDYAVYEKITAGSDAYVAATGDALFGNVITSIPNNAWTTLWVSIVDETGEVVYSGSSDAKTVYEPGLVGNYFNDNGQKAYKGYRIDSTVNQVYDDNTAPFEGLGGTKYSIVWDGYLKTDVGGVYTIETNADDGIRVYIDGVRVVQDNGPHIPERHSGTVTLVANQYHKIMIEYYNGDLGGTAELYWSSEDAGLAQEIIPAENLFHTAKDLPGQVYSDVTELETGLVGEYYDIRNERTYVGSRVDEKIDQAFDINTAPYEGLTGEFYAIDWTGYLKTEEAGSYIITSSADDGVYVWVNGVLLIGDIGPHFSADSSVAIQLEADTYYEIRVEYYNGELGGSMALSWQLEGVDAERSVIPAENYYHLAK